MIYDLHWLMYSEVIAIIIPVCKAEVTAFSYRYLAGL